VTEATERVEPAWQSRAVARSLERARSEAEARSAKIVAAATELVQTSSNGDFTILAIVDRLHISTRTFYQHFSGKDELIVAMFEEAQRNGVRDLQRAVDSESEPLARLRAFVMARQASVKPSPLTRLLIHHHFRLQESHPDELRHALAPVTELLRELVADGAAAGLVRDVDVDKATQLLLQTVTTVVQSRVLGSGYAAEPPSDENVWEFCLQGIRR
jgi:AcrR family transcriptional regulator